MLSRPFTSTALNELIGQGRMLMQKENAALWKAKPLLTRLVGDNTWAPCGLMTAPDDSDALLFTDTVSFFNRPAQATPSLNGASGAQANTSAERTQQVDGAKSQEGAGQPAAIAEQDKKVDEAAGDGETLPDAETDNNAEREAGRDSNQAESAEQEPKVNGSHGRGEQGKDGDKQTEDGARKPDPPGDPDVEMGEVSNAVAPQDINPPPTAAPPISQPATHPPSPAAMPSPDEPFIHPLFRLPQAAHPDRDVSLPEHEAEEVRRLLLLYVQKQEEICRGTKRLYEGLLKADRYRRTVWQWSKAEAHCGPNRDMSDGEDWYDKEEWGLEEDLKKGEDEVEEDTAATQKKTRNRK